MPDVICHGGGELSESTHGADGTDGQRPEEHTPETRDTSAEALSAQNTPEDGAPVVEGAESVSTDSGDSTDDRPEQPEPEFISPITFKTSGSFFRERVARSLAEQGFDSDSDGDAQDDTDAGADPDAVSDTEARETDDTDGPGAFPSSAVEPEPVVPESDDASTGDSDTEPATEQIPVIGADTAESAEPAEPAAPDAPEETTAPAGTDWFAKPAPAAERTGTDSSDRDTSDTEHAAAAETDPPDTSAAAEQAGGPGASGTPAEGTPSFSTAPDDVEPSLWPEPRRLSQHTSTPPEGLNLTETAARPDGGDRTASGDTPAAGSSSAAAAAGAAGLPGVVGAASYSDGAGASGTPHTPETADTGADASHASAGHGGPDGQGAPGTSGAAASGAAPLSHGPGGPSGPGGPKGPGGPGGPTGPGGSKGGKGKKGGKAKKPLWWRILRVFLIVAGLGVIAGCAAFAFLYTTIEVPDAAQADALTESSTFYYSDGETAFAERGDDREIISYSEMTEGGDHIVDAVISAEDRGFWTEPGVSVRGTTRAVWSTITGQQVQGGSTVTQQMVRNYYEGVSREQTVSRKIQEIIIAIKIDQSESKEWVMEQYLNTIYFGRQAYGVQAAAEAYYHKDVQDLSRGEAAFLAAAIQQPSHFGTADVETTPEMEQRWQYVVDGMVTTGSISQSEADKMEFPTPEPERATPGMDLSGYRGYMLQEAMSELERLGYTEDMINRQGYRIVTTFDKDMMDAAYDAVTGIVPQEDMPEGINIGLSTVDPETGEVLAFFGGHDYNDNQYDSSFLGSAQAGSAFKPYVLATALKQGIGLNTTVDGRGPQTINGSTIQNAGNAPGGVMTLSQATQVSNNLGYIELAQRVGFEEIRQTAYDAGLPENSITDNQLVPVMPLGANSVRPIDQASGYGTFANGGTHVEAHVVREIVNSEGENERPEVESDRAFSEDVAADLTYALEGVANSGTGRNANLWDPNHPTAGKTGTVRDEQNGGTAAAWFVGYTPQLSTSVGVYSDSNSAFTIPGQNISSVGLPSTIWNTYMSAVVSEFEPASFPGPAFVGTNENWAPDLSTETPDAPVENDDDVTDVPVDPEPEVPVEPEPEVPVEPAPPDPGTGGDGTEDPGTGEPGDGGTIFPPPREEEE
ncbi:transglycosylase domain-containing protein [Nocardiopsis aegyptia]|uniref:Membrane peptidoglycan carboxypeptidase n=1 Tax=Nocardiopsis aegyptia TaxID=220378 RepID=A0A7Z0EMD1_9ACTN|nr:transglycosylase domain-containing protein [Nocardiopsis aegyptia]NYJ33895.1 membrane peptidoglycan carboxypeptidase [Nocardiopsis aegyptia]